MSSRKVGFILAFLILIIPVASVVIPAFINWIGDFLNTFPNVPSFSWFIIFSDLSKLFGNLRGFIFSVISIVFGLTLKELFTIKAQREAEVNQIESKEETQKHVNWIYIARIFVFTLLCLFIVFEIAFLIFINSFQPLNYIRMLFSDFLFLVFLILVVIFIVLRAFFMHTKEYFARDTLITSKRSRIQKYSYFLKILTISNLTLFITILILSNFFIIPFISVIQQIIFYTFIFISINVGIYFVSKRYFDLNYSYYYPMKINPLNIKKNSDKDHFFSLSNSFSPLQFQKGFVVLELKGILTDLVFEPNYKIIQFIKEFVLEVQFSKSNRRILFWLFADGFRETNLIGKLQSIAEEFSSLFPMAQTRILGDSEVNDLINGSNKYFLFKSKKEVGLDFLNPLSRGNKIDELLRALTSFSQDVEIEGSIIFNFQLVEIPRKLLKKKRFNLQYSPTTTEVTGLYKWKDSFDIETQKQTDFETRMFDRAFKHALFRFDLHVMLKHNFILSNPQFRTKIFNQIQVLIYKIYNIKITTLSLFERIFLDSQRIKFRQTVSEKMFSISGDLMKHLLIFPIAPHLNLHITKNMRWDFPETPVNESNSVILGKLIEYRTEKFWLYPKEDLCRSLFIPGIPGMGKTTFISRLVTEVNKKFQVPFLIFDLKNDYTQISDEQTLWLAPGLNFFLNLFDIKGDDPSIHAGFLSELIKSMYPPEMFSPVAQDLLYNSLENACNDPNKRSIEGFWEAVQVESGKIPPRNRAEIVSGLRVRLGLLFRGAMGRVIQNSSINIYDIFTKKTVVDLKFFQKNLGASFEQMNFLTQLILRYLYYHILKRSDSGTTNNELQHITIIDDASSYIQQSQPGQVSFLQILIQLCRSMKEGLVVANQGAEDMDDAVITYPNTIISFRQPDVRGIVQKTLGLSVDDILPSLEKFTAVVRNNQSKMPFIIHTIKAESQYNFSFNERIQMTNIKLKEMFNWEPNLSEVRANKNEKLCSTSSIVVDMKDEIQKTKNLSSAKILKEWNGNCKEQNNKKKKTRKKADEKSNIYHPQKNMKDLFREIARNKKVKQRLEELLEIYGFLEVQRIQDLLLGLNNSKMLILRDEGAVNGFIKVLVNQDKIFAKKSFKIDGKTYPVLILAKNSHVFDQSKQSFMKKSIAENKSLS
ncbi:MAG: ATP-binding protein [Promethearchaeota archaeon]